MFRRAGQRTFARFNSSGHGHVSKYISESAFPHVDKKAGEEFIKKQSEKAQHSEGITNTWKRLTYLIAFPAIALTAIPVVNIEMHHAEHRKHLRELPDEEWPSMSTKTLDKRSFSGVTETRLCSGTLTSTDTLSLK